MNLIEKIDQRFQVGTLVGAERAYITATEWAELVNFIDFIAESNKQSAAALSRIKGE